MQKNMQPENMQIIWKKYAEYAKKYVNPTSDMQNSDMSILCIFSDLAKHMEL